MKAFFALCAVTLITAAIVYGGSFWAFVNVPSLLIVVGLSICIPLATFSPSQVLAALGATASDAPLDAADAHRHISVLQTIRTVAAGSGIIGTLIGLIQMLQHMEDPSAIGPAMAVALLTLFYGFIISELIVGPAINRVNRRLNAPDTNQASVAKPNTALLVTGMFGVMFSFFTLIVGMDNTTALLWWSLTT